MSAGEHSRAAMEQVYALLARRRLNDYLPAYKIAREAVANAEGDVLLALHEAIVQSLDKLLSDLGEHGALNLRLVGLPASDIDVQAWNDECTASWKHAQELRAAGRDSRALVAPFVAEQIYPIGSRDWLTGMRLGVKHRQQPDWVDRLNEKLGKK
jgi:hypothetical protein